jgi:hypothetical protein
MARVHETEIHLLAVGCGIEHKGIAIQLLDLLLLSSSREVMTNDDSLNSPHFTVVPGDISGGMIEW